jgi:Flp pilus assembly protein TadD
VLLAFASRVDGGSGDPRLLAELAAVQSLSGEQTKAIETAHRTYALQRTNGRAADVLARIMRKDGRPREADRLLVKMRQLDTAALAVR